MPDFEILRKKPFNLEEKQLEWVRDTLSSMSLHEKIGQLFHLVTYTSDESFLKDICERYAPGGMMARALSYKEACRVSNTLQKYSKIPMLISANLESGGDGIVKEGTNVGPNMLIGATSDVSFAALQGEVAAAEGIAVGANYAFAPVIDIDYNFRNPITNTRLYGDNAEFVAKAGAEFTKAVQSQGMCVSLKHFPGDGVDERDQHLVTSVNSLSCSEWDATYGAAYREGIEAGALTVMVGHIMLPAYSKALVPGIKDEEIMPATLSPELINGLLRGRLGFNGMIITDSSTMAGMCIAMDRRKAVPYSIASGCDMFLFTKNLDEDYSFMEDGIDKGILTPERLNEAVMRILGLKAALHLPEKKADSTIFADMKKAGEIIGCDKYKKIEKDCADKGITLVKDKQNLIPLSPEKFKRILLYPLKSGESAFGSGGGEDIGSIFSEALHREGFIVDIFKGGKGFEGMAEPFAEVTEKYDLIIYAANLITKSNQTTVRIEWENPMGVNCPLYQAVVPTIFISFANPYHLIDVPRIRTYINAYKFKDETVRAVIDKLMGRSRFKGKSPVDAFCGKWDARL